MQQQNAKIEIDDSTIPDIRKALGNPKITFVLGGPASGKGTQCAKLVEEFGYTHISTGDLFRAEVKKGSREGEKMKRIMNEGGLIPYQLTVQVLVNALLETPSKNYLIDGFPRAEDQAIYFEQVVGEAQTVLYFNTPLEVCVARCLERAKTSGRADDTEEIIQKRLQTYNEQSIAVVDLYEKFGKVRSVDGSGDPLQVWKLTRQAMLPQVSFLIGTQASGKSTLGQKICERTNAKLLNYNSFVKSESLEGQDDDSIVLALIQALANEISPRVVLEDFPQTKYQAKFFIKNCVQPQRVFLLNCSKDCSQERMITLSQNHPSYLPSSVLSQRIRLFNERNLELLPYLRAETNLREINTESSIQASFKEICSHLEPTVLTVRSSGSEIAEQEKANITSILVDKSLGHQYIELNVSELIQSEVLRKTDLGNVVQDLVDAGKNFWFEHALIVKLLRKIIYSGVEGRDKFLLNGYPNEIEEAVAFETNCAQIKAIIFTSASFNESTVEIKGDVGMQMLETTFSKQFRLKVMKQWDESSFNKLLGSDVSYGVVIGRPLSGKTLVSNHISSLVGGKVISLTAIADQVKKTLGTEEEPFEGEVPSQKVFEAVLEQIELDRMNNKKFTYIFDGGLYPSSKNEFQTFTTTQLGQPDFLISCNAGKKAIDERYKKKNEIEEISEDAAAALEQERVEAESRLSEFVTAIQEQNTTFAPTYIQTDLSLESTVQSLRNMYSAKVVIVNHEKRLQVDTASSNIAIKYNMLYLSVHQLIKQHIEENTAFGQQLKACHNPRTLSQTAQVADGMLDEFGESTYSPVHFDSSVVMKLIQHTVAERRTNQRIILLEGLCNNNKMETQNDKLQIRFMDEIFQIEKNIGEIAAVISLQYLGEPTTWIDQNWEEFAEVVVEEKKVKPAGEGEDEEAQPPAEPEGEGAPKTKWNPADYKWSISDKKPKNLPQLFRDHKGSKFVAQEVKKEGPKREQIAASLDEFFGSLFDESNSGKFLYQQVIFNE